MNQLTLIVLVLVVYMGAMLLIGWLGRSKSDNFDEYVTAAKKGSFLLVCGSYIGSHIGNGVVVGGAQNGVVYGLAGVWFGLSRLRGGHGKAHETRGLPHPFRGDR